MRCLQVELNGALLWRAGIDQALMYSLVFGVPAEEAPADVYVTGMYELNGGQDAHVSWGDFFPVQIGDRLAVTLVESGLPTPPAKTLAVDDPEHIEEQRQYQEFMETYQGPPRQRISRWRDIQVQCSVNGSPQALAKMAPDENHILCTVLWNRLHPDRCRVSVRSFGEPELQNSDWLRVDLATDDRIEFLTTTA